MGLQDTEDGRDARNRLDAPLNDHKTPPQGAMRHTSEFAAVLAPLGRPATGHEWPHSPVVEVMRSEVHVAYSRRAAE